MDVREKLVELLREAPYNNFGNKLGNCYFDSCLGLIADHLITNGVTVQEWISVDDRLPVQPPNRVDEQGRSWFTQDIDCIVYDGKIVFAAHYSFQNKFFWYSDTLHPLKNITHWMEMPQPPKGVNDAESVD